MKRTRKWEFVAQEAGRLAALSLSPAEIAKKLGVNKSTVTRWIKAGKLSRERRQKRPTRPGTKLTVSVDQTPKQWAKSVRKAYALDVTDDQLVNLAESALATAFDATIAPSVRMLAAGRFQALVRQLQLAASAQSDEQPGIPEPAVALGRTRPARPPGADPRTLLMMVRKP